MTKNKDAQAMPGFKSFTVCDSCGTDSKRVGGDCLFNGCPTNRATPQEPGQDVLPGEVQRAIDTVQKRIDFMAAVISDNDATEFPDDLKDASEKAQVQNWDELDAYKNVLSALRNSTAQPAQKAGEVE